MKYANSNCKPEMKFEECELAILRSAVDNAESRLGKMTASSPEVKKIVMIVENFLRKKKLLCYGGTAINNILPKQDQFYNKEVEIPDYDFYSPNALRDAKELTDEYFKEGFDEVEAKPGMHAGTYKVFVNFIPVADITYLHKEIYNAIKKDSIRVAGIYYTAPNYLRMSMFLELSRPAGDVSRWEKILKRLTLLNKHYPLKAEKCDLVDFQRQMDKKNKAEIIYEIVRDTFIDEGFTNVKIILKPAIGEIIAPHYQINVGADTVAFIYKPIACHSYNIITIGGLQVKIATIDTMLSFYLAFLYSGRNYYDNNRVLCMAQYLFEVQQKNRLKQKGLLRRFSINCYGHQQTVEEIRAEKAAKFMELKNMKNTKEYEEWFLRYRPLEKETNVSKKTNLKKEKMEKKDKTNKRKPRKKRENTRKRGRGGLFIN